MKRFLLFSTVVLTAGLTYLSAQDSVSGTWVMHESQGDGTIQDTFLQLTQNGESVSGTVSYNYRQAKLDQGSFKGGTLHLSAKMGRTRTISYDGALKDGELKLTSTLDGAPSKSLTAARSTPEAMKPPAPLPLPALHDVAGNGMARTPPMGWNSWNHFHRGIDDSTVRAIADAMVTSGLKKAGYVYVNIDDAWQGGRDTSGNITSNNKFPNMKALADYVHAKGLKIGLYSSPGPTTCAAYTGSFGHEVQDAKTYADWGYDYLKYDWCSASAVYKESDMQAVYQKMGEALKAAGRPILFSLCQYGRADVWTWGAKVGGNAWRTTGDISDNWASMESIGFKQAEIAGYAAPGHWNDPDMLEIGNGGMTEDEYKTHMSLWSLLAAPLLAGNDVRTMPDATLKILTNADVIAIDQDPEGHPVKRISQDGKTEVWARPLQNGSMAVGLFNRDDQPRQIALDWSKLGIGNVSKARDLWNQEDIALQGKSFNPMIPKHGVLLLRVTKQ